MHPAPSVILFTTLSGLGFGLLAFLGIGLPDVTGWVAFVFFAIGFSLAVGGLLASTFHLGRPERAWRALTQWRSSWLSREGCASVAALAIMGSYATGVVFWDETWRPVGVVGAALSLLTVFTTSMIYAQLKTVPRWNLIWTPLHFVSLSLTGGALLAGQTDIALGFMVCAGGIQLGHWHRGDRAFSTSGTTLASATGLGKNGTVRAFEPPHTGNNYLLREFAYEVGRKHRRKLRGIALGFGYLLPFALLALPMEMTVITHVAAGLAVITHLVGILASRWLFFAEAEHVVGLYYGKR